MRIKNVKVYGLEESILASGYPMQTQTPDENDFCDDINTISYVLSFGTEYFNDESKKEINKHLKRIKNLAQTPKGSGHDQFLSGIHVDFDLTCTNKMWVEMERYRFVYFVSSQSTMHRISKFNLKNSYIEYVDPRIIKIMEELKQKYNTTQNKKDFYSLIYSNPAGFELTARLTTNYRSLKTIYSQRKTHKLEEWRKFCSWIETLPLAKELIISKKEDK